jgi:6-phosphogluconolactonase
MSIANLVYVGGYSVPMKDGAGNSLGGRAEGIVSFRVDPATGKLTPHGKTPDIRNPSYLCFDAARQFLYCVNELSEFDGNKGGGISAYRIDRETGALTFLNARPSRGEDPCHIILDPSGNFVLAANYSGGSFIVYRRNADGSLGEETAFVQHQGSGPNTKRQEKAHPHMVTFDPAGRFLFIPDLGLDRVMFYTLDAATGRVTPAPQPWVEVAPGAGPRHIVFHPSGKFAYVVNELDLTVTAIGFGGKASVVHAVSSLPPGASAPNYSGAGLQITPDGKWLYSSNRVHESIAIYGIDQTSGRLSVVGHEPVRGRIPRDFCVAPSGKFLIVANQETDNLVTFAIDPATGRLTPGAEVTAGMPTCVKFV